MGIPANYFTTLARGRSTTARLWEAPKKRAKPAPIVRNATSTYLLVSESPQISLSSLLSLPFTRHSVLRERAIDHHVSIAIWLLCSIANPLPIRSKLSKAGGVWGIFYRAILACISIFFLVGGSMVPDNCSAMSYI